MIVMGFFVTTHPVLVNADGSFEQVIDLDSEGADIECVESESLLLVPIMSNGRLAAYRLE